MGSRVTGPPNPRSRFGLGPSRYAVRCGSRARRRVRAGRAAVPRIRARHPSLVDGDGNRGRSRRRAGVHYRIPGADEVRAAASVIVPGIKRAVVALVGRSVELTQFSLESVDLRLLAPNGALQTSDVSLKRRYPVFGAVSVFFPRISVLVFCRQLALGRGLLFVDSCSF